MCQTRRLFTRGRVSSEAGAKIEVLSNRSEDMLREMDKNLLAVVGPNAQQGSIPTFAPGSIQPIADFIEREILVRA